MSTIAFINNFSRFLRDQPGRLAAVPLRQDQAWKAHRDKEKRQDEAADRLRLIGFIAAIYVAIRIGLTYGIVGHF